MRSRMSLRARLGPPLFLEAHLSLQGRTDAQRRMINGQKLMPINRLSN